MAVKLVSYLVYRRRLGLMYYGEMILCSERRLKDVKPLSRLQEHLNTYDLVCYTRDHFKFLYLWVDFDSSFSHERMHLMVCSTIKGAAQFIISFHFI